MISVQGLVKNYGEFIAVDGRENHALEQCGVARERKVDRGPRRQGSDGFIESLG